MTQLLQPIELDQADLDAVAGGVIAIGSISSSANANGAFSAAAQQNVISDITNTAVALAVTNFLNTSFHA